MSESVSREGLIGSGMGRHFPPGQFLRYMLIGGWNTAFGFGCFFVMNRWLATLMPAYSYMAAYLASSVINITVAFLGYKWFVFRTRGNYFREWVRTLAVYGGSMVFATLALAPLVGLIRYATRYQTQAPYIAGALITIVTVISSFLGHRNFSFRKGESNA